MQKNSLSLIFLLLGMITALSQAAFGQTEEITPPTEFLMLSMGRSIDNIYYRDQNKEIPVYVPNQSFSETYKVVTTGNINFYTKGKNSEGNLVNIPLFAIKVPKSSIGGRIMGIVFTSRKDGKEVFRAMPFPFTENRYKKNLITIFNFNKSPIAASLGGKRLRIPPSQIKYAAINPNENGTIRAVMLREEEGKFVKRYDSTLFVDQGKQSFIFLYPNPSKPHRLAVRVLNHTPGKEPEPEIPS